MELTHVNPRYSPVHRITVKASTESTGLLEPSKSSSVKQFSARLLGGIGAVFLAVFFLVINMLSKPVLFGDAEPHQLPFEVVTREKLTPGSRWGAVTAPFPTGAWWSNVAGPGSNDEGDQIFAALPYQFKVDSLLTSPRWGGGLQVSYGPLRRSATTDALIDWFGVDLCVRATEEVAEVAVSRFDPLSVDVNFALSGGGGGDENKKTSSPSFTALLSRGSPYVTLLYQGDSTMPLVVGGSPLIHWEEVGGVTEKGLKVFRAVYANPSSHGGDTVTWLFFFEASGSGAGGGDVELVVDSATGGLATKAPYQGILRAALVPPSGSDSDFVSGTAAAVAPSTTSNNDASIAPQEALLTTHAPVYPVSADVSWDLHPPPSLVSQAQAAAAAAQAAFPLQAAFAAAQEQDTSPPTSPPSYAAYSYTHQVARMGEIGESSSPTESPPGLLQLMLPHHIGTLVTSSAEDSDSSVLAPALVYATLKGPAIAAIGGKTMATTTTSATDSLSSPSPSLFTFVEKLTSIGWFSPLGIKGASSTGAPEEASAASGTGASPSSSSSSPSSSSEVSSHYTAALLSALQMDTEKQWAGTNPDGLLIDPKWLDPYGFGKAVAKVARLALIAEELGNATLQERCVEQMADALGPWLEGSNQDSLVYDTTWGGLISSLGKEDQDADFGNGWYNDHHFHYGYLLMAVAVVQRNRPEFLVAAKSKSGAEAILRDVANPGSSRGFSGRSVPPAESATAPGEDAGQGQGFFPDGDVGLAQHFPMTRHKDWYDGHSWASGVFPMVNGKSQESVSEAVNCYFAVHLLGLALEDDDLSKWGRLLLAMELRAAHWYWQMGSEWSPYPAVFSSTRMAGVVGSSDTKVWTWFGTNPEYVHGINMMPFTPITEELLKKPYVQEEFPVIEPRLDAVTDQWKGLIELARAVLDPVIAFDAVVPLENNRVDGFDAGNSLTNSLYWVATRPETPANN